MMVSEPPVTAPDTTSPYFIPESTQSGVLDSVRKVGGSLTEHHFRPYKKDRVLLVINHKI